MFNVRHLATVGYGGLKELLPTLVAFFSDPDERATLDEPFGRNALVKLLILGAAAALAGQWFARFGPGFPFKEHIDWGTAISAVVLALLIRRYVFASQQPEARFRTLAFALVPTLASLLVTTFIVEVIVGRAPHPSDGFADESGIGAVLMGVTRLVGLAAALTIAVAALCYSRDWIQAIIDLAVRLFVFKLLLWVTALVLIEIGIVGAILGGLLEALTGITIPAWVKTLSDQISYAALLLVAYGFIIAGTWQVCRETYPDLLETGAVNLTEALEQLSKPASEEDDEDEAEEEEKGGRA